jgi:hypothetical protein
MLDFLGTVVIGAVAAVNLNAVISALQVQRMTRLLLATVMGGWIGVAAASAISGVFAIAKPFPLIGLYVATPLIVGLVASLQRSGRGSMLALPLPLLIGLNISRALGVFFLLLAAQGRLSGPFPYFAGIGDIATGLAAIPLVLAIARGNLRTSSVAAWNAFGAADLILAIVLGVTSAPASALQIFGGAVGSLPLQLLPWALIPTVLVPFYLVVHVVIWLQLRQRAVQAAPSLSGAAVGA